MLPVLLLSVASALGGSDCATVVGAAADTPLEAPPAGSPGSVLLELVVDRSLSAQQLSALTHTAAAAGAEVLLRVDPAALEGRRTALVEAAAGGHPIALELDTARHFGPNRAALAAVDTQRWRRVLSGERKELRKATKSGVKVVSIDVLTPSAELVLDELGVRLILPTSGAEDAAPRLARAFDGQPGRARVVAPLAYGDHCGHVLPAPTAGALNRAAAAATGRQGLRVGLHPELPPALLAAWLGEVLPAADIQTLDLDGVRDLVDRPLISVHLAGSPAPAPVAAPPPGRTVRAEQVQTAATQLATTRRLPRTLAGELSLAEAFAAFALTLSSDTPAAAVRIPQVRGPADVARSTVSESWQPTPPAVRAAAAALAPNLGGAVPAVVTVDDQLLATREFLVLMADVIAGRAPQLRPVSDPDPFAVGAGWD